MRLDNLHICALTIRPTDLLALRTSHALSGRSSNVQGTVIKFHKAELDSNFLNNFHSFKEGDIGIFGLAIF